MLLALERKRKSFFCDSPFFSDSVILMRSRSSGDSTLKFWNKMQIYDSVVLSYSRDSVRLISDQRDDKLDGVDSGISM